MAVDSSMYTKLPNLVIGFHGCDKSVVSRVVEHGVPMGASNNAFDWLGHGLYFWENNLDRARQWAESGNARTRNKIETPAVLGAVIDLGFCLNLTDSRSIELLKRQYEIYRKQNELAHLPLAENKDTKGNEDLLLRYLDCAVIESLHVTMKEENEKEFDSVRGVFVEGQPIYPNAGFREKTHIQICVRNPNCIKGFFLPRHKSGDFPMP